MYHLGFLDHLRCTFLVLRAWKLNGYLSLVVLVHPGHFGSKVHGPWYFLSTIFVFAPTVIH